MSHLTYWTGGCILEYLKGKDIPSFGLVCKQFRCICDEKAIKTILATRFKETQLDLDFDTDRRKACKVKSCLQWLCMLEENLSSMIDKPRLIKLDGMFWVEYGDIKTTEFYSKKFPEGYKIVGIEIVKWSDYSDYHSFLAVIVQPPTNSDTELWLSINPWAADHRRATFVKVNLPVNCRCLRQIRVGREVPYLLSEAGILYCWKMFDSWDIVRARCLKPVFKICGSKLLTVGGNLYENDSLEVTEIAHPNIKFTDILNAGLSYYLSGKDRKFYEIPFSTTRKTPQVLKEIEIETIFCLETLDCRVVIFW
eukprot:Platyproteum_vivax@DN7464_c2_g1_i2.p1